MAHICAITSEPEVAITEYKWLFHEWSVLYSHYNGIQSPTISIKDADGCTCQITLFMDHRYGPYMKTDRYEDDYTYLLMNFENLPSGGKIGISTSLLDQNGSILWTDESLTNTSSLIQKLPRKFSRTEESYVINNTLRVHVKFTIVKSSTMTSSFSENVYCDLFEKTFQANLKALNELKSSHDVAFIVGVDKLAAHKLILAGKSEVFKAMFMDMEKEQEAMTTIDIDENKVSKKTVEEFLHYMYDDKVNNLNAVGHELIILANEYKVHDLKSLCENHMVANLDDENVIQYLLIAYELHCDVLKKQALRFIKLKGETSSILDDYRLIVKYLELAKIDLNE